jgi:hypothetical protein
VAWSSSSLPASKNFTHRRVSITNPLGAQAAARAANKVAAAAVAEATIAQAAATVVAVIAASQAKCTLQRAHRVAAKPRYHSFPVATNLCIVQTVSRANAQPAAAARAGNSLTLVYEPTGLAILPALFFI